MDDKSSYLVGVSTGMLAASWIMVALRFYVRLRIKFSFGLDDILLGVTLILGTAVTVLLIAGVANGMGKRAEFITPTVLQKGLKYSFLSDLLYVIISCLVKVSFAITLLRINILRQHVYILYVTISVVCSFSIFYFFWSLYTCYPISYFWERVTEPLSGHCASPYRLIVATYIHGAILILGDVILTVLPMLMIKDMHMTRKLKIWVIVIFSFGSLASIATIVRITYIHFLWKFDNFLYYNADLIIWSVVEVGISVIAAAIVTLRPLAIYLHIISPDGSTDGHPQSNSGSQRPFARTTMDVERRTIIQPTTNNASLERHIGRHTRGRTGMGLKNSSNDELNPERTTDMELERLKMTGRSLGYISRI